MSEVLYPDLELPGVLRQAVDRALRRIKEQWESIDRLQFSNQRRVLEAFQRQRLNESDFLDSSGYGYSDRGREKLELAFARSSEESGRWACPQIVSGTHALAVTPSGSPEICCSAGVPTIPSRR